MIITFFRPPPTVNMKNYQGFGVGFCVLDAKMLLAIFMDFPWKFVHEVWVDKNNEPCLEVIFLGRNPGQNHQLNLPQTVMAL